MILAFWVVFPASNKTHHFDESFLSVKYPRLRFPGALRGPGQSALTSPRESPRRVRLIRSGLAVPRLVFVAQHGRANLFDAAGGADNPDEVGAAQAKIVRLADIEQLFKMMAGHFGSPGV